MNINQINESISNRRFSEVYALFENSSLGSKDLLKLYKKQNEKSPRLFDQPEFWQSEVPLLYINEVMESEMKSHFLHKYFSKNDHANDQLNVCLFLNFKKDFLRYYKLNRSFLFSGFRESLSRISVNVPELERLTAESQLLQEESELLKKCQTEDDNLLLQLDFDEIFMGLVLYYQHVKCSPEMNGEKAQQFKLENVLLELVHHVLTLKKNSPTNFRFSSNEKVQEEFIRYQAPHPILGKEGLSLPLDKVYLLIFEIADRYIELTIQKNLIELYQCGYVDLESIVLKPLYLQTNEEFERFHRNDYKKGAEDHYFIEITLDEISKHQFKRNSIQSDLNMFDFYGIPMKVNIKNDTVDLEKAMTLLRNFSVFKGPLERTILRERSFILNNEADESFRKLFGTNESISCFDHDQLRQGISKYFGWSEKEVDILLQFLTYDLIRDELPHYWIQRPFLKISDQIIWLGTFLKDRRWSNILLNKLKKELALMDIASRKPLKEIATNLEKKVESVFKHAGFKTLQGLEYKFERKPLGDLDVAAYKDNYLFLCEVKSGERSHDFSYAANREMVKLEEGAVHQLRRALKNKHLYFNELERKLDCEINWETIKIIPMIVTDTFEGDQYFKGHEIRKVSLVEIDVILKNKKRELFEAYRLYEPIANRKKFDIKTEAEWDLWNGQKSLSCERLLEIIDNNEVWSDFMQHRDKS